MKKIEKTVDNGNNNNNSTKKGATMKKIEKTEITYIENMGFAPLTVKNPLAKTFSFLSDFAVGRKPLVQQRVEGENVVSIIVSPENVFVHVENKTTGETFCRKSPEIKSAENEFGKVKTLLRHFSNKKKLAVSNILQTRICHEVVKL